MPTARPVRRAAVVLAGLALIAGCSSDTKERIDGTVPSSTPDTVTVVTDAPTTTQVPTAATPLVRQAVIDYWAAQLACQQRPRDCRPASFTAGQGTLRADVTAAVSTLLTNGWHR